MAKKEKRSSGGSEKSVVKTKEMRLAKEEKRRAQKEKTAARLLADKARFQRSDRKSISSIVGNREADVCTLHSSEPIAPVASAVSAKTVQPARNSVKRDLARNASVVLSLAAGVFILMGMLIAAKVSGAEDAIRAFGGDFFKAPQAVVPDVFRLVLLMDTLFPMFLGAGFAMLLASVQNRGNRPMVRLALTAVLVGVLADFTENALVFSGLLANAVSPFQIVFSIVKYGAFALTAVLASALIPVHGIMGWVVRVLLLFIFPFIAAFAVSKLGTLSLFGIEDKAITAIVGGVFLLTMLALAIYAAILSEEENA